MNANMEELKDMKAMWIELNNRITSLEEDNRRLARQVMNNDYKSAKEKLIGKYRFFIFFNLMFLMVFSVFILANPMVNEKYRIVTFIYWMVFFLGEAATDAYLMIKVKQIDIYNSTVSEISRMAARNWKTHKIAIAIGLPVAIGAVILYGLLLNADNFVILGMVVGGLIGGLIGFRQLMKFLEYYKLLQNNEE